MVEFKEEQHDELRKFSSGPIQNEVLTLTSEYPSSADHFGSKFQAKISPYEKSLEKQEEELIESTIKNKDAKDKCRDVLKKSSSGTIQNEVLTVTSEHLSSKDQFERKLKDNISPYNQSFEQPE